MRESEYQAYLIRELKRRFPGCVVLKNDTGYMQGIPDLTILFEDKWAVLEVKASEDAPEQPNQEYYINALNAKSYAAFIYPENEEVVLDEIQQTFQSRRTTRRPRREQVPLDKLRRREDGANISRLPSGTTRSRAPQTSTRSDPSRR